MGLSIQLKTIKGRLVWVALVGILASQTWAQKPNNARPFEVIPASSTAATIENEHGTFDAADGHALVLYNLMEKTEGSDPQSRALNWISLNASRLGIKASEIQNLRLKHVRNSAGTTVRFTQTHQGLPVYGAEVVINMDDRGYVRYVHNAFATNLGPLPAAMLSSSAARSQTINTIGLQGPLQVDQVTEVAMRLDGQTKRMYLVRLVGADPIGDFEALVDAETGAFHKLQDISCYHGGGVPNSQVQNYPTDFPDCDAYLPPAALATGTGFVFDADPLSQVPTAYAGAYVDGSDATNASLDAARVSRTLNDITLTGGTYSLEGPYAAIREFENPNKGLFAQASSTFNFNRNADAFEGVNTYYFIDMSMRYLNLTLGVSVMPYQYTTGVQFDAHGLNGADNSHYVGGTGRLAFGEGGVDDAEDSDVILHELGHGLHDWITVGGLSNTQGLSEGTGDYWTQSHSRSLGQWTTAQAAYHWVFNWDGHNPFWGGRITNYTAAYPGGLTGAIHTDGQIWSTCLMKIYDAIGRAPTDRALWEGLSMTGGTTNQQNAAIAVRQAAINMGYTSTQINTISSLLSGCGYVLPAILHVSMGQWEAVRASNRTVDLDWTTEIEEDHAYFVIERKLETEQAFQDLTQVAGSGQSTGARSYHHVDANAFPGKSFYRLRFVDVQGEVTYSEIREVAGSAAPDMMATLYPNPSSSNPSINLTMPSVEAEEVHVRLLGIRGEVVAETTVWVQGQTTFVPDFRADLPSGIYNIQLTSQTGQAVMRWVKE